MSILEKQMDALMRLCVAEKEEDRECVRQEVRQMLEARKVSRSLDPVQNRSKKLVLK